MTHHLRGHLQRVRPRRIRVRIVGLERDVVHTHAVQAFEAVIVAEEAPIHLPEVIRRRRLGDQILNPTPRTMLRLAATATGASGDVAGMRDDEPMCMFTTVFVSWQA